MSHLYLAGPWSGTTAQENERHKEHVKALAKLTKLRIAVFSPIAHSHEMVRDHDIDGSWEAFEAIDREHIRDAREVWVLTLIGWNTSKGVTAEVEYTKSLGKRIVYVNMDELIREAHLFHERHPDIGRAAERLAKEQETQTFDELGAEQMTRYEHQCQGGNGHCNAMAKHHDETQPAGKQRLCQTHFEAVGNNPPHEA